MPIQADLSDLSEPSLRALKYFRNNPVFVCECGLAFELPVRHCLRCSSHSVLSEKMCQSCGHKPWKGCGATTRELPNPQELGEVFVLPTEGMWL